MGADELESLNDEQVDKLKEIRTATEELGKAEREKNEEMRKMEEPAQSTEVKS